MRQYSIYGFMNGHYSMKPPFMPMSKTKEIKKGMKGYEKEMTILKRNESTLTLISIKLLTPCSNNHDKECLSGMP